MHKICKHCGQEFEGVHNRLLCPDCNDLKLELICPHCNKAFILPDRTKREFFTGLKDGPFYCSRHCAFSSEHAKVERVKTTRRKYGVDNVSQSDVIKKKKNETTMKNYGVENPFQSEEIKERCRQKHQENYGVDNPSQSKIINDKKAATYRAKTGYDWPWQNPVVIEALHIKSKKNYRAKTGYDNPMQNPAVKEKYRKNYKAKTGYDYPMQNPAVRAKYCSNYREKTGYDHPMQNPAVHSKIAKSAQANGNNSSWEDIIINKLKELNAKEDIDYKQEYKDERYPFFCDFYFPHTDTFLEINGHWTHGYHWFNKNDPNDIKKLEKWKAKDSDYYKTAINIWTVNDPEKHAMAIKHNLNYLVLWNKQEVKDFCTHKLKDLL